MNGLPKSSIHLAGEMHPKNRMNPKKPAAAKPTGAAGKGERSTATKSKDPLVAAKPALLAGGNPQLPYLHKPCTGHARQTRTPKLKGARSAQPFCGAGQMVQDRMLG